MPRIDLNATEAQSMEAVPEGEYEASVVEVQAVKQGPKARYVPVIVEFRDAEGRNRKLTRNCPVDGPGAGIFLDLYNKATGANLKVGEIHEIDTDDLIGADLRIVVKHEEYEGEPRAQISKVLSA